MRHGPVSGPLHACVGLATAAVIAAPAQPIVDIPAPWAGAGGAAVLAALWWRGSRNGAGTSRLVYRTVAVSSGTGWLCWVLVNGAGTGAVFSLAVGGVVLGIAARPVAAHEQEEERRRVEASEAYRQRLANQRLQDIADEWTARIAKVCRIDVQVIAVEKWMHPGADGTPRETGYTLEIILPPTGVGWRTLKDHQDALANAAQLPLGCGVEAGPGISRNRALLDVSTVNALEDDIPFPPADRPLSVDDPLDIGVRRDGSPALVSIRSESWVVSGGTGSGKSNELRTIINRLMECEDTLIVVIDKNGGGLVLPYLVPWVAGEIPFPPIAAVVDTDEEALKILHFLGQLIGVRKQSQAQNMMDADDDMVAASPRVPQIVVITDEGASMNPKVQDAIVDLSDRGRGSRIRTIYCALRATAAGGYLPKPLLAQALVRIGMRVNLTSELQYLFNSRGLDPADTPAPGYGFIEVTGEPALVHKGYRTLPSHARECAVRTAKWRPVEIEPESMKLLPEDVRDIWYQVWERNRHIAVAAAGGKAPKPAPQPELPARPARPASSHPGGMDGAVADMHRMRDRLRETMGQPPASQTPAQDEDEFGALVESVVFPPLLLIRLLAVFDDEDWTGRLHTAELERRIGAAPGDLGRLLPLLGVKAIPNPFALPDRGRGRGYARDGIEAAAEAIREGRLVVPEEVAAWQPKGS